MSETASTDTIELMLTDSMRVALDHAFEDSQECLERDGGMTPFSIICTSDGFDVADHPGATAEEVYESVKTLLAQELPEAYVFAYDGFVELEDGRRDAIICEVARRGEMEAAMLAQLYEKLDEGYSFAPGFVSVGTAPQLYPRGTKPIVSGLVALAAERAERASTELSE